MLILIILYTRNNGCRDYNNIVIGFNINTKIKIQKIFNVCFLGVLLKER